MKVVVDRAKCTGLGICESVAPEVFEVDEDGNLVLKAEAVSEEMLDQVQHAVDGCPAGALRLEG